MSNPGVWGYVALFLGSLALSSGLVPLAMRVAFRWDVLDLPGGHKGHEGATPYLGGAAIALATIAALAFGALLVPGGSRQEQVWVILGCLLFVSLLGLFDDLRPLPPSVKFLGVLAAAGVLWAAGVGTSLNLFPGSDLLLTLIWVAGITNAMNLLDNMDGLSAGVATVICLTILGLALAGDQYLVAGLAATASGSALGFLRSNRPPARIFMGDSGSLFLGLLLAVLGLGLKFPTRPESVTALVPVLLLGVPILDTTMVVVTRLRDGRPVTTGHRDHLSHRLRALGLPVGGAVGVLLGAQVVLAWLAVLLSRSADTLTAWMTAALAGLLGAAGAVALARVDIDASTGQRRVSTRPVPRASEQPAERG